MPKIKLTHLGNLCKEYRVDPGKPFTIGRRLGNDIVIPESTVSREHARIVFVEGRYLLTDLQSKNGILVNKVAVSAHELRHGDDIQIGKHHLLFTCDEDDLLPEIPVQAPEKTVFVDIDTVVQRPRISKLTPKDVLSESDRECFGVLAFLAGGEGETRLTKDVIQVGRDPSCDIVVRGLLVGKVAFAVDRRPRGYFLRYVGGTSIPKVSGHAVRQSMKLEDLDIIEIGSSKLQFFAKRT